MRRVPIERLRSQTEVVLVAWGMPQDLAAVTAEVIAEADVTGVDSHGILLLTNYDKARRGGTLDLAARARVVREGPATALLDAGGGLGHPAAATAMDLAIGKAEAVGIAAVGVANSHHFGAAGWYVRRAAARGMIGLVVSTARGVMVVPTRAAAPALGTNPIAFAAPAGRNPPLVLDMATSTVAANKVKSYAVKGRALPPGWVLDGAGAPVTDPDRGERLVWDGPEGGLTPLGGTAEMSSHKGYGLSLMVQVLAATLTGGSFMPLHNARRAAGEGDRIGHLCLCIAPGAFREASGFAADLDETLDWLRAAAPADPDSPVLIPGDPEEAVRRTRLAEGVPVPDRLATEIAAICKASGAPFLLDGDVP